MRLGNFIQETLYDIAYGVQLAQAKAKDLVAINPSSLDGHPIIEKSYVDFDVSIVVTEAEEKTGKGNGQLSGEISVSSIGRVGASVGGAGQKTANSKAEHTHRVAFKVPVYMNANYKNNPAAAEFAALMLDRAQG